MKTFIRSLVITAAALPFLVAAPAAKKAQNSAADQTQTASAKVKPVKKHKKSKTSPAAAQNAPAASSTAK